MQLLSQILTVVSFILIGVMLFTFRRIRSVSLKAPLVSIFISIVVILAYLTFIGSTLSLQVLMLLVGVGLFMGIIQGNKTRVWAENGKRKAQNTVWFLVIWALGYIFNQALTVTGQSISMNLGIGAMSLSTGVTVGAQGIIFLKLLTTNPGASAKIKGKPPGKTTRKNLKQALPPKQVSEENPVKTSSALKCSNCGRENPPGSKFCAGCGTKLQ